MWSMSAERKAQTSSRSAVLGGISVTLNGTALEDAMVVWSGSVKGGSKAVNVGATSKNQSIFRDY